MQNFDEHAINRYRIEGTDKKSEEYKQNVARVGKLIFTNFASVSHEGSLLQHVPNGKLPADDVLKTGDIKFIKEYYNCCGDWEKDLALNNYKDGNLEILKALFESGANFLIGGHSNPPSEVDAYIGEAYQDKRDKTKTTLTKLQLGIK